MTESTHSTSSAASFAASDAAPAGSNCFIGAMLDALLATAGPLSGVRGAELPGGW